jgi:hypothetical protein
MKFKEIKCQKILMILAPEIVIQLLVIYIEIISCFLLFYSMNILIVRTETYEFQLKIDPHLYNNNLCTCKFINIHI